MPKLMHIVTVPQSLGFFEGQVGFLRARGFNVVAAASPGPLLDSFGAKHHIEVHAVPMKRGISLQNDPRSLRRLLGLVRRLQPDIVHSHTPKAGLLGTLAARMSEVPVVALSVFGLPQMTRAGVRRQVLDFTTRVACRAADWVWSDSPSMARYIAGSGLCEAQKVRVLHNGSSHGVDATARFVPERHAEAGRAVRSAFGIPADAPVVGFVGRIVRDKGIVELEAAWRTLRSANTSLHLLLVGTWEPQDPAPAEVEASLREDPRVHLAGTQRDVPPYYAAMDVVCLPTYREGFPNVPLEAAAMGLPVVATNIPGCVDAVVDGVTGTLVPPRDAGALADALMAYIRNPGLRRRHGLAGRERVLRDFRPEDIWEALYQEYVRLLKLKGLTVPEPRPEVAA